MQCSIIAAGGLRPSRTSGHASANLHTQPVTGQSEDFALRVELIGMYPGDLSRIWILWTFSSVHLVQYYVLYYISLYSCCDTQNLSLGHGDLRTIRVVR